MDHLSARRQRLWEAMESCRFGTDDLGDPEFADLSAQLARDPELFAKFERLQEADRAVKAAFVNVPVPAGLTARISLRLVASEDSRTAHLPAAAETTAPRFSRRRLLVGFTALAAAAGLLAAVWIETHRPRQETPASVLDEALDCFGRESQNQPGGELVSLVPPPAEFPFPVRHDIVHLRDDQVRWRRIDKFLGGSAVAYDLPAIGGRATLYVINRTVPGLPACPPDSPNLSTGGRSAAAWQSGETLYVLVVDGDAGSYSRYLDQSHGPLT
jgi:hypothetical protein